MDELPFNFEYSTSGENDLVADLPLPWVPRWYQEPSWRAFCLGLADQSSPLKRLLLIAHRRWGKDDILLHGTNYAMHRRVGSYWHMLPQYSQARKAIWTAVNPQTGRRRIDEAFPIELRAKTLEHEMFIRMKNGSTFQLLGSDNYNNLVGAGICGLTVSEWALSNPASWAYIQPMLIENNGWAAFITTPRGRNHAQKMLQRAERDETGVWYSEVSDIHDTMALTDQQLSEALLDYTSLFGEDIGKAQFEQEYECSFNASILGAYYAHEMRDIRQQGRIRKIIPVPGIPIHRAWDIGVGDSTTIWWFQVYRGVPYILDCYGNSGLGVDHYAEIIKERGFDLEGGVDYVPHDAKVREWGAPGARTRVESMQREGLNPQLCPEASKADGIQAARITLKCCIIDPRCEEFGISALEQFRRQWDDDKKTFKPTEYKDWTVHFADAFRYLALSWREAPTVLITPKEEQPTGTIVLEGPPAPKSNKRMKF